MWRVIESDLLHTDTQSPGYRLDIRDANGFQAFGIPYGLPRDTSQGGKLLLCQSCLPPPTSQIDHQNAALAIHDFSSFDVLLATCLM